MKDNPIFNESGELMRFTDGKPVALVHAEILVAIAELRLGPFR
jgi:hypothetical protein